MYTTIFLQGLTTELINDKIQYSLQKDSSLTMGSLQAMSSGMSLGPQSSMDMANEQEQKRKHQEKASHDDQKTRVKNAEKGREQKEQKRKLQSSGAAREKGLDMDTLAERDTGLVHGTATRGKYSMK
jgi:hypothetical protein